MDRMRRDPRGSLVTMLLAIALVAATAVGCSASSTTGGGTPPTRTAPAMDLSGHRWTGYTVEDGLASNAVASLAVGADGSVWVGTDGPGLSRFDGTTWTTYTTEDGLPLEVVSSVAVAPDGTVWVGGERSSTGRGGGLVASFDGYAWATYDREDGLRLGRAVPQVAVGADGTGVVGVPARVARFDCETWASEAVVGRHLRTVAAAGDGVLWIGEPNRIARWDGGSRTRYGTASLGVAGPLGMTNADITSLSVAPDGTVYAGSSRLWHFGKGSSDDPGGGLLRFDGSAWTAYSQMDGSGPPGEEVSSVAACPDGSVWVTSFTQAPSDHAPRGGDSWVSRFDGRTWVSFTHEDGLPRGLSTVAVASDGTLWVGSSGGGVARFGEPVNGTAG